MQNGNPNIPTNVAAACGHYDREAVYGKNDNSAINWKRRICAECLPGVIERHLEKMTERERSAYFEFERRKEQEQQRAAVKAEKQEALQRAREEKPKSHKKPGRNRPAYNCHPDRQAAYSDTSARPWEKGICAACLPLVRIRRKNKENMTKLEAQIEKGRKKDFERTLAERKQKERFANLPLAALLAIEVKQPEASLTRAFKHAKAKACSLPEPSAETETDHERTHAADGYEY